MYTLQNESIRAVFDESGRLTELRNLAGSGKNIVSAPPADSFSLVFKKGSDWENTVSGSRQKITCVPAENTLRFSVSGLSAEAASADVSVTLTVSLEGEKLVYGAEIENRDDVLITDFEYPYLGKTASFGGKKLSLLVPSQSGIKLPDITDYLVKNGETREIHPHSFRVLYPGGKNGAQHYGSMNWLALTDDCETLFFSCRDEDFYTSELRAEGGDGTVCLVMDTMAFVRKGETWRAPEHIAEFYAGSWHRGAKEYAAWVSARRPAHRKPQWIRDMIGYFLVICKQQFGTEMWKYSELPEMYRLAKRNGCDTVGLFGWFDSGHDNNYPDLCAGESMGGAQALKDGIRSVQKNGGHVTMYFQGYLIDVASEYYRLHGKDVEIENPLGIPYHEQYVKSHKSSFLASFPLRSFVTACPSVKEWQQLMREKADYVGSFGCDGVLFDQIGGMVPSPCFNKAHHHAKEKPSLAVSNGRRELLAGIQEETKKRDSEFAFMTEHITDIYAGYLDALHGINSYPGPEGERGEAGGCEVISYPELYRYCFPDDIITLRNPAPYAKPRAVNYAFVFNFRLEMEIRYRADRADAEADTHADWRDYAAAVTALRRKHWDILGGGSFADDEPLHCGPGEIIAKAYRKEDLLAVTLWNDSSRLARLSLDVPGYRLDRFSCIAGECAELPAVMEPQQVAVALYRKISG